MLEQARSMSMTAFKEYPQYDALGLAELVRKGEVHPRELVEAAIERIERFNPRLNAVINRFDDEARSAADEPVGGGPFAGVPFLLKDMISYEGHPSTMGSRALKDFIAPETHEVVRRIIDSGALVLGQTNTPELGLLPTTESLLFGPAHSPWDLTRSPGGSSGGSAIAVATGMVPMAHGNDGGGSLRIPASACGVFGFKASRGRTPQEPWDEPTGIVSEGVLTRSVRDCAAMLDAVRGNRQGDRWWAPTPERPYLEELEGDPAPLRMALVTSHFDGSPLHPDCTAAVESTAALCQELGHDVEEVKPEVDIEAYIDAFFRLWCSIPGGLIAMMAEHLSKKPAGRRLVQLLGMHSTVKGLSKLTELREGDGLIEPWTWILADREAKMTTGDLWVAWNAMRETGYQVGRIFDDYDVILTSVLGEPPLPTGTITPRMSWEEGLQKLLSYVAFTPICNTAGLPGMSVPLSWNLDGLPIGSHFIGRYGGEATLFQLAAQLERARPWKDVRPLGFGV